MASAGASIGTRLATRTPVFPLGAQPGGISAGTALATGAAQLDAASAALDSFGPSGELGGVPEGEAGDMDAYRWLLAWAILILVLALLNRTRIGHTIIYYSLALMLILLVVVNYGFFAWALAPFQFIGRAVNPGAKDQGATTGAASGTPSTVGEAINTAIINTVRSE